ncbi:MAG: ABC transporter permease [Rhizobiaceae bacterium]|nr:ABC transporter permease [Rhizobiaceae bacterium]
MIETLPPRQPWRRALRQGRIRLGLAMIGLTLAVAFIGPFAAPNDPAALVAAPYDPPGPGLWLGADMLGRDVFSRFLNGGRNLVWMSVCSTLIALALGGAIGLTAAYARGLTDQVLMRLVDVKLAFPSIVFALLFVTMFGPGLPLLVLLVGISQAPNVARVMRGAALSVVDREFVWWARMVGLPPSTILRREILPNVTAPLLVEGGLRLMWSTSMLAGLSFLGYGIQPPLADWGLMINENRNALTIQPFAVLGPIVGIGLFTIGGNMLAEGISRILSRTEGGA